MKNALLHPRRGFTLIELMVVIAIIAILAAITVPNFIRSRAQGQLTACKSNLKSISTALEMYSTDTNGRFPTTLASLTTRYLKVIPSCPSIGATAVYSNGFTASSNPDAYTVVCSGNNHSGAGFAANYPQYTSGQGLRER